MPTSLKQKIVSNMHHESVSSIISTSLENLDNILPMGLTSKKHNGNRKTLLSKTLCSNVAAVICPKKNAKSDNTWLNAKTIIENDLNWNDLKGLLGPLICYFFITKVTNYV